MAVAAATAVFSAVRAVCSPEWGDRPCRHAFSFNRHACSRGVPLLIPYATWRTVLYGVAYLGRRGASTRHACFGRGGQHRHVAGRGAPRPFSTPRVAYVVLSRLPSTPRGLGLRDAWRTAVPPHPPRAWAWRLGTPRVAYPLFLVRHAFVPACPCVLSDRASGPRPASGLSPRQGRLPSPRGVHPSVLVCVPLAGRSPPQVSFFRGSLCLRCAWASCSSTLRLLRAPVAPRALAADAALGSSLVPGRGAVWLGFARSASGRWAGSRSSLLCSFSERGCGPYRVRRPSHGEPFFRTSRSATPS